MSFRGLLRPGQGFAPFRILRRVGGISETGRPYTSTLQHVGDFYGIITNASPKEVEQSKQRGTPITHTIVQRGAEDPAKATDILELEPPLADYIGYLDTPGAEEPVTRRFIVRGEPENPGNLGNFLIYKVEERADLL